MNAHNHDFTDSAQDAAESLEQAARRISEILRLQSGLDTDTLIVPDAEKPKMVFRTNDTNTEILKKFLTPEMNNAALPSCREPVVPYDIQDYPGTNYRGAVSVDLHPKLISTLIAKL